MTTIRATFTADDRTFTATLRNGPRKFPTVDLACDGVFAGTGIWTGKAIEDCPAVLPDEVFDGLALALEAPARDALLVLG